MNRNLYVSAIPATRLAENEMKSRKLSTALPIIVSLLWILILSPVIYSLTNSILIQNSGRISTNEVTAKSGSPQDIQAAVDWIAAAGGGTVHVPAGTFRWNGETVNSVGGVNIIGAGWAGCDGHPNFLSYTASTILHNTKAAPFNVMFDIDSSNHKPFRISGIQFEGNVTSSNDDVEGAGIAIGGEVVDFRVDHCTFINFPNIAVWMGNYETGTIRGVIDHCVIDNPYKDVYGTPGHPGSGGMWGYGAYASGPAYSWDTNISHFLGKYDTAPSGFPIFYIEDNHFSSCRHATDCIQGGWDCVRYNLIDLPRPQNFGEVDIHGPAEGGWTSGRGVEVYNNTIVCSPDYAGSGQAIWIRGGGGAIYNNTFVNQGVGILLNDEGSTGWLPEENVHSLYIWGNTMQGGGTLLVDQTIAQQDVDYFLRAPNQTRDGFSYTPYPYPHPLVIG
jgi:hypothetical protein